MPKYKGLEGSGSSLWKVAAFLGLAFGIASFVIAMVAITAKDNDTKYVIPDVSSITPSYNTTLSTRLIGAASNSPNATIMLSLKGNIVTLEFLQFTGNCSTGLDPTLLQTDVIPSPYAHVSATSPTTHVMSPNLFILGSCTAGGNRQGLAYIDTDGSLYMSYDFAGETAWNGQCIIYPFTLVYNRFVA